jgi:hypothetical protein
MDIQLSLVYTLFYISNIPATCFDYKQLSSDSPLNYVQIGSFFERSLDIAQNLYKNS